MLSLSSSPRIFYFINLEAGKSTREEEALGTSCNHGRDNLLQYSLDDASSMEILEGTKTRGSNNN